MQFSDADLIWNRACMPPYGFQPSPGDSALTDMLGTHGLIMNGGLWHCLDVQSREEVAAGAAGYAYFGFDEMSAYLLKLRDDPKFVGEPEEPETDAGLAAREAYIGSVENVYNEWRLDDEVLSDRFKEVFRRCPSEFAEIVELLWIRHSEFRNLRLSQFLDSIQLHEDWHYLGCKWLRESTGFTEWLRPVEDVDSLGILRMDLKDLPVEMVNQVFERLQIPLRTGMELSEVIHILGFIHENREYLADRKTYAFQFAYPDPYEVTCTLHVDDGLSFFTMVPVIDGRVAHQ